MYLQTLHLRQFRNYQDCAIDFLAPKTILVGNNAQGKSNLLEAVELLSTLKSHRVSRDRDLIRDTDTDSEIRATVARQNGIVDLGIILRANGRRTVMFNRENCRRHLDFLGILKAVQFSSLDLNLVRGGPDERRHWLDRLLIQLEPIYAHILHQYNQVLRQRNALLKLRLQRQHLNPELVNLDADPEMAIWDAQLATSGSRVTRRRARALVRLAPLAQIWHQNISGKTELLEVRYAPNIPNQGESPEIVEQVFLEKIQTRAIAETHQGISLVGPHRDEIELMINQTPAKSYGSQGQQRTLVLALKLAELQLIEEVIGEPPLLLLDDVLAELDIYRQNQLLEAIQNRFQTLITTTHLGAFDSLWLNSSQILAVDAGKVVQCE